MMRFLQEPDAGDLHVRFDEGRVGRTSCRPLSYSTASAVKFANHMRYR